MSLKYVLNSMKRRKLRTFIIAMALTVGVALVGALLALVDTQRQFSIQTIGAQTGGYDLAITKSDTASTPFFNVQEVSALASQSYDKIAQVLPRIESSVEARKPGALEGEAVTVIAYDAATDNLITQADTTGTATSGLSIRTSGRGGTGISVGNAAAGGRAGPGAGGPPAGGGPPPDFAGGLPPDGVDPNAQTQVTPSAGVTNTRVFTGSRPVSGTRPISGTFPGPGGRFSGTGEMPSLFPPAAGQVYLNSNAADLLGVQTGDMIQLSYAVPIPRQEGKAVITGTSTTRLTANFMVGGVGSLNGVASTVSSAALIRLSDAQAWLGQTASANQMLLVWQSKNSGSTDAHATVTAARDVGESVRDQLQAKLGPDYTVSLPKYTNLENVSAAFQFTQIFISLYGILSLGIVGLMVNALMTTTVAEEKHDLAVLRVLGSPTTRLYQVVIIEVILLGIVGIVLGLILGRLINDKIMSPILLANLNLPAGVSAEWTLSTVLIPTAITALVLTLATIAPARAAAATKVMVVLNPAAADQPTLDDIAKLRERRADRGLLIAGLVLMAFSAVILVVQPIVFSGGNFTGQVVLNFASLLLMVIGISLLFYFLTTPLERVLIWLYERISKKASFFAGRYSKRGKGRNALISLMVVMSGVLPTLLATQLALQDANIETDSKFSNGSPLIIQSRSAGPQFIGGGFAVFNRGGRTATTLSDTDIAAVQALNGIDKIVPVANALNGIQVSDNIKLRSSRVSVIGVGGDLSTVLYPDLFRWSEGDASALTLLTTDPTAVIVSQGMATSLDLHKGDSLLVAGTGTDHYATLRIAAIASRVPGFSNNFSRNSSEGPGNNSGMMVNMSTYRELQNDPANGSPDPTTNVVTKLYVTTKAGTNEATLVNTVRRSLNSSNSLSVTATADQVTSTRAALDQGRVFIVLLTALSMITAVFGVLAVMYTAIFSRRLEIGMLKAIGASRGELRGSFIGEAVITTVSAGLAGIIAGTLLGYVFVFSQRIQNDQPLLMAFDFGTAGLIVALVTLAAIVSGAMATQPVIRNKAITILRER
ncbi:MAG TPA: FtsX-like permease family protein [Thermoflexales bacterium]|nr:FtsX-like permease family protein [Thermoflexales bacterium]HQW34181.1 FtsX-like permease family protein [Thermoflexales bacterium]HQX74842.1 FtsX-like permease family protein [Thermoflexales bacterium]